MATAQAVIYWPLRCVRGLRCEKHVSGVKGEIAGLVGQEARRRETLPHGTDRVYSGQNPSHLELMERRRIALTVTATIECSEFDWVCNV